MHSQIRTRDRKFKIAKKSAEDARRRAKFSNLKVGDRVYIRDHDRRNKVDQRFLDAKHVITARSGGRLTLKSLDDNSIKIRKTVDVKLVPMAQHDGSGEQTGDYQQDDENDGANDFDGSDNLKSSMDAPNVAIPARPQRTKKTPLRLLDEIQATELH